MYSKYTPIQLVPKFEFADELPTLYLYTRTGSDKEDWFIILRRVEGLPEFADEDSMNAFYHDLEPVKDYNEAMEKLVKNTLLSDRLNGLDPENQHCGTEWLNALLGRFFVGMHTNSHVKDWIKGITMRSLEKTEESFLGDIHIKNLNVGKLFSNFARQLLTSSIKSKIT